MTCLVMLSTKSKFVRMTESDRPCSFFKRGVASDTRVVYEDVRPVGHLLGNPSNRCLAKIEVRNVNREGGANSRPLAFCSASHSLTFVLPGECVPATRYPATCIFVLINSPSPPIPAVMTATCNGYFLPFFAPIFSVLHARSTLDSERDAHPAADTQCREPTLGIALLHFMQQRHEDSCAGRISPIGWPMAIAPPFHVHDGGVPAHVFVDGDTCAANASLASIRSRSATFQPAFSRALREAGIGPNP